MLRLKVSEQVKLDQCRDAIRDYLWGATDFLKKKKHEMCQQPDWEEIKHSYNVILNSFSTYTPIVQFNIHSSD